MTIKNLVKAFGVFILISSCSTDESSEEIMTPPTPETLDLVNMLTDGSQKIWKIETANLTNSQVTNLDITGLTNVNDDELTFTIANGTLDMRHNFGFKIDIDEDDITGVLSDTNQSSINRLLSLSADSTQVSSLSSEYTITTDDQDHIIATIQDSQGAILELELTPKNASDYPSTPVSISSPVQLFAFEGKQPNYDMIASIVDDGLYVLGRLSDDSQQLIKYDLNNDTTQSQVLTGQTYYSQQIALVENNVIAISYAEATGTPADLNTAPVVYPLIPATDHATIATLDDALYAAGGFSGDAQSFLGSASLNDNNFSFSNELPSPRTNVGFEIIDNVAYILGGQDLTNPQDGVSPTNNGFYTNLDSGATGTFPLPTNTHRTYSAKYQNLIYIAGRTINTSEELPYNYFAVYDTLTNQLTEIDITAQLPYEIILRSFTVHKEKIYFLVQDTNDVPSSNDFALKVLEANLQY